MKLENRLLITSHFSFTDRDRVYVISLDSYRFMLTRACSSTTDREYVMSWHDPRNCMLTISHSQYVIVGSLQNFLLTVPHPSTTDRRCVNSSDGFRTARWLYLSQTASTWPFVRCSDYTLLFDHTEGSWPSVHGGTLLIILQNFDIQPVRDHWYTAKPYTDYCSLRPPIESTCSVS